MRALPLLALTLPISLGACRTPKTDDTGTVADGPVDADGDGFVEADDCDDTDASVNPEAPERCNEVDDDCDGDVDEGVTGTFFADGDGDGFGDAASPVEACDAPTGTVTDDTDCDDDDPAVNPDATEVCNAVDDDCDGDVDEDVTSTFYADADADGFGDSAAPTEACAAPSGTVSDGTDCDDTDATSFPGGTEVCDEADNDCNGLVDDGVTTTFYEDRDGDGYGVASAVLEACALPGGYAADAGDCDDTVDAVNPGATEVCNGTDDDCDGDTDEDDASDASTWYDDTDVDGYGDPTTATTACTQPSGTVADDTDCDDTDADVNPGATEVCNGTDDDCDGDTDDADSDVDLSTGSTWYSDTDVDGFGDPTSPVTACDQPSGTVTDDTDCDDADATSYPGGTETCDGADNDCDGFDDTLGYWAFETGSGTTAFDASSWAHDGVVNGASWTTAGYSGGALDFDGSNDDVELDYTTLEPTTGFTISAWVNPDSLRTGSWDSIVSRGSTGTTSTLGCCADPYYVGYYLTGMSFYTDATATLGGLVDGGSYSGHVGNWHHVLVTADYTTGTRTIYVDGVQTATDTNAPSTPFFDGAPTRIGADTNNGAHVLGFDGRIDEVKIFDCPVTSSQAAADFASNWPF